MNTVCKFKCESVTSFEHGSQRVKLRVDLDDRSFTQYTPDGSMEMLVNNPALSDFFKPGQLYRINIQPETTAPATQ